MLLPETRYKTSSGASNGGGFTETFFVGLSGEKHPFRAYQSHHSTSVGENLPFLFLLCLIALPLIEIATFIVVGDWIGVLPTIGLVILTTVLGLVIVRWQGLSLLTKTQADIRNGKSQAQTLSHGVFLTAAGMLLAIPGFVSDVVAFMLLIPPVRNWLGRQIIAYIQRNAQVSVHMTGFDMDMGADRFTGNPTAPRGPVIDGEIVEDLTPGPDDRNGTPGRNISPWRQ